MITTPLLESSIELNLPEATKSPEAAARTQTQVISIDHQGQVYWGETPLSLPQIDQQLERVALSGAAPILAIRGDREVTYQYVISVLDLARKHGLTRLHLDTSVK